jgi:hypothetical protein
MGFLNPYVTAWAMAIGAGIVASTDAAAMILACLEVDVVMTGAAGLRSRNTNPVAGVGGVRVILVVTAPAIANVLGIDDV